MVLQLQKKDYKIFDRENTSFIKQLLEDLTHINCTEYDLAFSLNLIECNNNELTDSIKYYYYLIEYCITRYWPYII
ncbi:hypothetical protein BpHYR1_053204 [Brachionus plicatilis]|uniref:Uncharacterized protein n=1 Tax=Brachionus plicatilis TaxID=10195 RepID=A0A3M7PVF8_BRAPC|nr:hypothetical protein BpHYR1_053204 [Brachionus plicatilis]